MKKILVFLMSSLIALMPSYVWASAAESWTIEEVVYDNIGKNLDYTAKKVGTAANDVVYKARVPVTAAATGATVATMIRMGIAGALVYGLVEGVGWVIENGVVKKRDPSVPPDFNSEYLWTSQFSVGYVSSLKLACPSPHRNGMNYAIKATPYTYNSPSDVICHYYSLDYPDLRNFDINIGAYRVSNSQYNPDLNPPLVPVPDSELGEQIIQSPNAPQILPDVYNPNNPAGGAAPSQTREALDNANPEPVTQPEGETSPRPNVDTDGDGVPDEYSASEPTAGSTFKLPKFCEWAPAVCDFFTVQKKANTDFKDNQTKALEQDKTFFDKVTDFFDWSKNDTELPPDETPSITELPTPELNENYISWGQSCPADVTIPITLQGVSSSLVFSWSPWCQLLSIIRPAIVASAYIGAAFIVLGLRT